MAIKLEDKPNVDAPGGDYPYGNIRDNTGSGNGTPVNKLVYADFHQFFARLLAQSGVVANNLPDNNANGFQYFEALQAIIDSSVAGLIDLKGDLDASSNPNYPVALKGDSYIITVEGKVGGASGKSVQSGDYLIAKADNAGGTEASVGASWFVLERNIPAPVWNDITLINGWAAFVDAPIAPKPQYRIDEFGVVHLRGVLNASGATAQTFTQSLPLADYDSLRFISVDRTTDTYKTVIIGQSGANSNGQIVSYNTTHRYHLDGIKYNLRSIHPYP
jgi:hypothetical protein